jgi:hypothetical protein
MNTGENESCTEDCIRELSLDKDSKQYEYNSKLTELAGATAELVTFLDIDETGQLDFII